MGVGGGDEEGGMRVVWAEGERRRVGMRESRGRSDTIELQCNSVVSVWMLVFYCI